MSGMLVECVVMVIEAGLGECLNVRSCGGNVESPCVERMLVGIRKKERKNHACKSFPNVDMWKSAL